MDFGCVLEGLILQRGAWVGGVAGPTGKPYTCFQTFHLQSVSHATVHRKRWSAECAAGATPPTTFFLGRRFVASMGLVFWHFLDMFWFAVVGVPLFFK